VIQRALITGASGFVAQHLATHLMEAGADVVGAARGERPQGWESGWRSADVRDHSALEKLLGHFRPNVIFHLASAERDARLQDLLDVNVAGTQVLVDAAARTAPAARVVVAGSSAEYGFAQAAELPLDEDAPLRPFGPYGIAKCAQSLVALAAAQAGGNVIVTRTFNLVGPGEPDLLVCSALAHRIAALEADSERRPLAVGNLESTRDFVDVRDAVRAYALAAEQGVRGQVYNVCSGTGTRIASILDMLVGKARVPLEIIADPALGSVAEVPAQVGDGGRLAGVTGWAPTTSLDRSLDDLLNWWRQSL
jgi:GDP-4-dehydro-6-deoxy-D-mannose reductase